MSFSVSFAMRSSVARSDRRRTSMTSVVALFCPVRSRSVTKVAIVDDHEALREGLERMLEDRGVTGVGRAGNGAAAEDPRKQTRPDVALVDIRLPDESGIELTRRLLGRRPGLGVALYTGDSDAELLFGRPHTRP